MGGIRKKTDKFKDDRYIVYYLCRDDSFSSRSKTRLSCLISLGNKDPLKSFLDSSVQGEGGVIIQVPTHRGYIPIMNLTASYTAVTFTEFST